MDNEEIVPLLREIRDLQKETVKNQRTALESQSKAIRSAKTTRLALLVILVAALAIAIFLSTVR